MDRSVYFERVSDIMNVYPELEELSKEDNIIYAFIQYWARNDKYYDEMGGSEDALIDLITHLSGSRQKLIDFIEEESWKHVPDVPVD